VTDQATVSFSPPVNDGGAPIYQFTVTAMPGGITATGTGSPITVTGLTDGVQYTFTVTATNAYGTGPASAPSNAVTPSTTPSAPTDVQAFNLNGVIQLFFEAPFNGGSPIIDYTATSTPASTPVSSGTSPITISGLTLGTSYTFVVTATNANGIGPASVASNPVTPSTGPAIAPSPPTGLVAAAGVNSAVVTFTPGANGGSPITDFAAKASPGGVTVYGATSPLTVTGLTAETSYTFTVTATNAVGTSSPSAPSNAVTPIGVAGAPTAVTASAGAAQATVAFTAPAYNGGSAVFNYLVSSSLGGAPTAGATSPILVTGLTNGQPYTFTVKAQNAAGIGPPSSPSNSVVPSTVPGAPAGVTAAAGNAQAVVSFTAPATGGSPITAYTATASPGGAAASGAGSPLTLAGLTNGTQYTFTVTATNANGTGLPSAPSTPVTPSAVVPSAPQSPAAAAGNAQATVTFSPPASTGGAPITGYVATASPGGANASGSASPLTVPGLINGLAYTFTVAAVNSAGTGAASVATNAVTPSGLPFAPTGLVATPGNAQASVAFTAANGNGTAITGYTVTSSPGGITGTAATSPILVTGLTNGIAYTFTATATNTNGTSAASAPSRAVTPATVPSAPTSPVATAGNANASVAFSAPASTGGSAITSYIVTSSAGQSASGAASPVTVPNLTNGTAYTFTVIAVNSIGAGPSSVASNSVTPYAPTPFQITTTSLPSATTGVPYSASVVAANGAAPYTYVNTTAMPAGLSISSTGAISGTPSAASTTSVGFQATDSAGNKTAVTSLAITVSAGTLTVPSAPTALTATPSNAAATVSFLAPASTGGTPITGYTVTSSPGALTGAGSASPLVVTGLTNGQAYTFTATATNAIGTGAASAPSNSVTPTAASALAVLTNGALNTSAFPYDYSYSGTFNYGNTTNLQSGTTGNLEVTGASQYGSGWQPASNWPAQFAGGNNGIDLSAYTSIQFSVYAAHPATISLFKHYTRSTGNDIATSCGVGNITNVQSVPANTWTSVTVNLALIGGLASFNDYKTALQDSTQENWFINSAQYLPGNYAWIYNGDPNKTLQSGWADASTATVNYAKSPNSINSSLYAVNNPPTKATVFTGAISGTTLTVSGLTGSIQIGQVVLWNGQGTPPTVISGSGSTWVISPTQGTVTSQQMVTGFNQSAINCVQVTSAAGQYFEVTTTGFSLSLYNNFTFAALPTKTGYVYKVQFLSTAGVLIGNSVTALTPQDNGVQTSAWNMYLVALSAFGLGSTTNIGGVRITNTSGATTDYYGAIGFVS